MVYLSEVVKAYNDLLKSGATAPDSIEVQIDDCSVCPVNCEGGVSWRHDIPDECPLRNGPLVIRLAD